MSDEESLSLTLKDEGVVSLKFDLDWLAAELAHQDTQTLITLIDKIDTESADWRFMEALEEWAHRKKSEEYEDPYG